MADNYMHVNGTKNVFERFLQAFQTVDPSLLDLPKVGDAILELALGRKVGATFRKYPSLKGKILGVRASGDSGPLAVIIVTFYGAELGVGIRAHDFADEGGSGVVWEAVVPQLLWFLIMNDVGFTFPGETSDRVLLLPEEFIQVAHNPIIESWLQAQ